MRCLLIETEFWDCVRFAMLAIMAPSLNMTVNLRETGILCSSFSTYLKLFAFCSFIGMCHCWKWKQFVCRYCRQKRKDLATKGAAKREKLPQKIEVTTEYNKYVLGCYFAGSKFLHELEVFFYMQIDWWQVSIFAIILLLWMLHATG